MRGLRDRARGLGLWARVGAALAVLGVIGAVAALAGDPSAAGRQGDGEQPVVADLPGRPLVDREGRPLRDAEGRPLRVAADGRTLVDSAGRPLRDGAGRRLRLGPRNRVPPDVRPRPRRDRRADGPRPPRKKRPPAASPDRSPIRIAAAFLDLGNHNELAQAFGVQQRPAAPRPQIHAVVSHINRTGGILGRRVELIEVEYDPASGEPMTNVYAALCARIAASRPLLAIDRHGYPALTVPCLAEAGIPLVASWPTSVSSGFFEAWAGRYISPGMLPSDRIGEPYVESLERSGYFTRGARIGVLHHTPPGMEPASVELRRSLARRGFEVKAEATVDWARVASEQEYGRMAAQAQRAAVLFNSLRISHVLSVDVSGGVLGLFILGALGQHYFPRYGINSSHAPVWLSAQLRGTVADRVFNDAVGFGWAPFWDVTEREEPPRNATRRICDAIFADRGVDVGDRSQFAQYAAYGYCDSFLLVRRALERSGSASAAGLRAGIEALGASHPSALNLGTAFAPGRLFGAAGFRLIRYDATCNCFRYGTLLE